MNNSIDNHHEANLFNSMSRDKILEKSKNLKDDPYDYNYNYDDNSGSNKNDKEQDNDKNVMDDLYKNFDNLKSTETDMMFQLFANQDKLVPDEVKLFEKPYSNQHNNNSNNNNSKNETINDFIIKNDGHNNQYNDYKEDKYDNENKHDNNYDNNYDHKYDNNSKDNINQDAPRPSNHGPSYGEGPSYPSQNNNEFASKEEEMLAKLNMLRQLGELTQKGVKLSQNYNMESDYNAMKYEYELHKNIRDKHNGTKWLCNGMLFVCQGIEMANGFCPFDINLKGWGESMNEDIDEYYDVLGDLYEKYVKSGKPIPPELKLLGLIGMSAAKFHFAKTALGNIPSLGEALSKNPELAKKLKEQSYNEKIKGQYETQKKKFAEASEKQHEIAKQKAADINMLNEQQNEFKTMQQMQQHQQNQQQISEFILNQQQNHQQQQQIIQQQLFDKQNQLEDLQKQLQLQRSDTRSMYTNNTNNTKNTKNVKITQKKMTSPVIPSSLKKKINLNNNPMNYNSPPVNFGPGTVIHPADLQEMLRQEQSKEQKKNVKNDYLKKEYLNINPNLDTIIDEKFNDNQSKISESYSNKSDKSSESKISIGRSTRKKKKQNIIIKT